MVDCGTGAHAPGQALLAASPKGVRGRLLISHTHWDHIQGLPFFAPLFAPGSEWDVYGPRGLDQSLRDALSGQMQYSYAGAPLILHDGNCIGTLCVLDTRVRALDDSAIVLLQDLRDMAMSEIER